MLKIIQLAPKLDGVLAIVAMGAAAYYGFNEDWVTGLGWFISSILSAWAWKYRPLQKVASKFFTSTEKP